MMRNLLTDVAGISVGHATDLQAATGATAIIFDDMTVASGIVNSPRILAATLGRALPDALPLVERLAPEHLEIMTADPEALADRIVNAGAIFLGGMTPEAIGDYVGGSNHVLPTARSARFSSGLGVLDFMKRTSLLKCDARSLAALGPAAVALGRAEALDAHARSVAIRLGGETS